MPHEHGLDRAADGLENGADPFRELLNETDHGIDPRLSTPGKRIRQGLAELALLDRGRERRRGRASEVDELREVGFNRAVVDGLPERAENLADVILERREKAERGPALIFHARRPFARRAGETLERALHVGKADLAVGHEVVEPGGRDLEGLGERLLDLAGAGLDKLLHVLGVNLALAGHLAVHGRKHADIRAGCAGDVAERAELGHEGRGRDAGGEELFGGVGKLGELEGRRGGKGGELGEGLLGLLHAPGEGLELDLSLLGTRGRFDGEKARGASGGRECGARGGDRGRQHGVTTPDFRNPGALGDKLPLLGAGLAQRPDKGAVAKFEEVLERVSHARA